MSSTTHSRAPARVPAHHRPPHVPLPRVAPRFVGPASVAALVVALAALWLAARPAGTPARSYAGQLVGAEAVLLLSIGLVLVSSLPWVEPWFDGIDRAAIWHRRVVIAGLVLLVPHVALAANESSSSLGPTFAAVATIGLAALAVWAILPRWRSLAPPPLRGAVDTIVALPGARHLVRLLGGYERWRTLHRTTGVFVALGFVHGLLDGTPFGSGLLRWSYVAIGAVGLAFYAYRELLARWFAPLHDYQVETVRRIAPGLVEIALRPLGRRFEFVPGQFAMLYLEGKDGWHRHPFTISSGRDEELVRVTVKALGDTTSRAHLVEPGMPAVLGGPHGRFDFRRGTERQVWLAAGVGVTPFLSWLRSARSGDLPERVDFFYSAAGTPPFAAEIVELAADQAGLRVHLVDTERDGRLTPESVLAALGGDTRRLSVFMCGPAAMLRTFQTGLRLAGVRGRDVHREHFDWR
ncbi:MAG: ferredoxin reductase family protein [Actinomycetota bacterium]